MRKYAEQAGILPNAKASTEKPVPVISLYQGHGLFAFPPTFATGPGVSTDDVGTFSTTGGLSDILGGAFEIFNILAGAGIVVDDGGTMSVNFGLITGFPTVTLAFTFDAGFNKHLST